MGEARLDDHKVRKLLPPEEHHSLEAAGNLSLGKRGMYKIIVLKILFI